MHSSITAVAHNHHAFRDPPQGESCKLLNSQVSLQVGCAVAGLFEGCASCSGGAELSRQKLQLHAKLQTGDSQHIVPWCREHHRLSTTTSGAQLGKAAAHLCTSLLCSPSPFPLQAACCCQACPGAGVCRLMVRERCLCLSPASNPSTALNLHLVQCGPGSECVKCMRRSSMRRGIIRFPLTLAHSKIRGQVPGTMSRLFASARTVMLVLATDRDILFLV